MVENSPPGSSHFGKFFHVEGGIRIIVINQGDHFLHKRFIAAGDLYCTGFVFDPVLELLYDFNPLGDQIADHSFQVPMALLPDRYGSS